MEVKIEKDAVKKIVIFCISYFAIFLIVHMISLLSDDNNIEILKQLSNLDFIIYVIKLFVESIVSSLMYSVVPISILLAIFFARKKSHNEKLSEIDFNKYKDYYRDLLKYYSIEELDYIDDFKLEYKTLYVAKLLELQNKKVIAINENTINIIGYPTSVLDKLFIDSIISNKVTLPLKTYKENIIYKLEDKDLICIKKQNSSKIIKTFFLIYCIALIMFLIIWILGAMISNSVLTDFMAILGVYTIVVGMIFFPIYIAFSFTYSITRFFSTSLDPYIRTKEGEELNKKIEGLKNYLKDFSSINKKESKDLILWEDYLIYSVMFNQNKNIIDEYQKFLSYENIEEIN